ncbi:hypothetical protein [Nonomuraea recticatena]|uniref:hypothetical protein n=1 Tax=Nonomuraea recticatena TaxID=46178 RepID=UPI003612F62E
MTSADLGLLSAGHAGSAVAAATGDEAFLQALLDAEAALTRAWASLAGGGFHVPEQAGLWVTEAARAERFDLPSLVLRAREGGNPVIPWSPT